MKRLALILLLMLTTLEGAAQKTAAAPEKTRVLIILDCSNSMWDKWQSEPKIKVTQKVLLRFLDSIRAASDMEVALRVFGHLNKDAYSTQLEVPFEADNTYKLQSKIKTLVPNGGCTAATALTNSLRDFPHDDKSRNIILIITDGMDDCGGNICEVARQVQQSGTVVQTFIIGIGNAQDFQHQLDCAGRFTFLPNEEMFAETLHDVFFLSDQQAHITLSVTDGNQIPYETEIPVVFYDHQTHAAKYTTIYHYATGDTVDTLTVDPLVNYDITLFTKPPVHLPTQQFKASRHNHLVIPAPQGSLRLHFENKRISFQLPNYSVLVRRHGETDILSYQPMGTATHYLAGSYDIEVLSSPILRLSNVTVRSGSDTDLQLPLPGQLALNKPQTITTGSIFVYKDGSLQWVCDLNPDSITERIVLLPGEYQIILKPKASTDYTAVRTARFTIQSAQQTGVNIK